jgi:hypothetical protein
MNQLNEFQRTAKRLQELCSEIVFSVLLVDSAGGKIMYPSGFNRCVLRPLENPRAEGLVLQTAISPPVPPQSREALAHFSAMLNQVVYPEYAAAIELTNSGAVFTTIAVKDVAGYQDQRLRFLVALNQILGAKIADCILDVHQGLQNAESALKEFCAYSKTACQGVGR